MYDAQTVSEAREIVEKYRRAAAKLRNMYGKKRSDEGWYPCSALMPEGRIKAGEASYIWFEVEDQLKKISIELVQTLLPTESLATIKEYAKSSQQLDALMKEHYQEFYDEGKRAKLNMAELVIFILGKVIESK